MDRFQKSDKEVKLKKLYESNVPGVEFGVYASVEQVSHLIYHKYLLSKDFFLLKLVVHIQ